MSKTKHKFKLNICHLDIVLNGNKQFNLAILGQV